MELRAIDEVMGLLEPRLDTFDKILREGHSTYESYPPEVQVELDARAQATCTYCHIVAEAERRFVDDSGIRPLVLNGDLRLWLIEDANVVIRFKKTDEDGLSRNYPTRQARFYDAGRELDGLPPAPARLTVGYLLNPAGEYVRTQIALPRGRRRVAWCAAVVPAEDRKAGDAMWINVTSQSSFD